MSTKKMLLLASMALAAIAFAAPVAAQAKIVATAGGVALKKDDPVTATSKNLVSTVGGNSLTCEEVVLHYKVAKDGNGPNNLVLNPTALHNATPIKCVTHIPGVGTFTNHITNAGAGQISINTWGTGVATATFTTNTTTVNVHCSYTATTVPIQLTDVTDEAHVETEKEILHAPEPGCATGEMHGTLTFTSGLNPVIVDFVKTG